MDDIKPAKSIRYQNNLNPNFRRANIEKSHLAEEKSTTDYSLMYGMGVFWDTVTFGAGLIPGIGWIVNVVLFGGGLLNMYLMSLSRGNSNQDFWNAYKYIFIEPVPYLNIIPTFTRGVYLLKNKESGLLGTGSKMLGI